AMIAPGDEAMRGLEAVVLPLEERAVGPALALATRLRDQGMAVGLEPAGRSLKALLRAADRRRARLALILGEDELRAGRATVRDLARHEDRPQALPLDASGRELAEQVRTVSGAGA
ncbi:MAG TPA: His/Gly/Thr/Pro-type tRNA ligase C-terminal domain-containing protein, partial [Candidatus Binatia bacterium]|nr:His/Gly/Thr/Pro-type tRNA ligase C-terminal domain-containing protein [Candidatus Binatia bacterium]